MNEELFKEIMFQKFILKMILKRVYNLNDSQWKRVVDLFENESEEATKKYLERIGR